MRSSPFRYSRASAARTRAWRQVPFQILGFQRQADTGVAYVEHRTGACYLERAHEIEAHTVAFEHLAARALSLEDSVQMVREVAKEYV
ncbi:Scr1 family TA system antitoxin-like transcriptional regulator [Streptomyces sp. NPDC057543]|uniref:Scr1 family TA system antitoxin-like transcriptional regulator n=1 Tax=Streptomyces sp. NPDC057543 TaxID=3346163 RepID=UPI0036877C7B